MSDRIRMAESDRPPEETTEPQPPPPPQPEPEQPAPRREGPEPEAPPKTTEPEDNSDLPPSFQERLNRSTREKWELRRQVEQAQAQVREIQQQFAQWQQATQGQSAQNVNTTTDAEQRAFQRFQQQAAEERFNEACNAVYQHGKQEFADFDDAVRALIDVGAGQRPDFLSAVAQLPDGHRVYRQLASDLDNAGRIMRLPPMQMAMELALLSGRSNGAAQPPPEPVRHSRAPAPLRPIGGTSRAPQRLENMTMAEFIKQRDKEEGERRR